MNVRAWPFRIKHSLEDLESLTQITSFPRSDLVIEDNKFLLTVENLVVIVCFPYRKNQLPRFYQAMLCLNPRITFKHYQSTNRSYFIFTYLVRHIHLSQKLNRVRRICGLDPGVSTFQHAALQQDDKTYTSRVFGNEDKLLHNLLFSKSIERENEQQKQKRQFKLMNVVNQLHYDTIRSVVHSCTIIKIPNFNKNNCVVDSPNSSMCDDGKMKCRVLNHPLFVERLTTYAKMYGVQVKIVNEAYSTRTCSQCGFVKPYAVSLKIRKFECENCGFCIERDFNAAIIIAKS